MGSLQFAAAANDRTNALSRSSSPLIRAQSCPAPAGPRPRQSGADARLTEIAAVRYDGIGIDMACVLVLIQVDSVIQITLIR